MLFSWCYHTWGVLLLKYVGLSVRLNLYVCESVGLSVCLSVWEIVRFIKFLNFLTGQWFLNIFPMVSRPSSKKDNYSHKQYSAAITVLQVWICYLKRELYGLFQLSTSKTPHTPYFFTGIFSLYLAPAEVFNPAGPYPYRGWPCGALSTYT